jgi:hypothetical protein
MRKLVMNVFFSIILMIGILSIGRNAFAADSDGDGIDDAIDNCRYYENPDQGDWDKDGQGNECDCDDFYKGDNEDGADCGGICEVSCPDCVPLVDNGLHNNKIDIVFVPDIDYIGNMDKFITDAMKLVEETYFGASEIYAHRCKFNFYYYPDFGDYEPTCLQWDIPPDFYNKCSFADSPAIVFTGGGRACSGGSAFSTPPGNQKVAVHETGHKIFGLHDEYCCDGGYGELQLYPNVFDNQESCELKSQNPSECMVFCPPDRIFSDDLVQIDNCKNWWFVNKNEENVPYCSCSEFAIYMGVDPNQCVPVVTADYLPFWEYYWSHRGVTDLSTLGISSPNWCNYRGYGDIIQCCVDEWWTADLWECYMGSGTRFGDDCSERVLSILETMDECGNPGEPADPRKKVIVIFYTIDKVRIIPKDIQIYYNYPPDHYLTEGSFRVRQISSADVEISSFAMQNPLEFSLEEGDPSDPTILMGESVDAVLVVPFLNLTRTVRVEDSKSGQLLHEFDLSQAILTFCNSVGYDDEQCALSDLDNDGILDRRDNCPVSTNSDQSDLDRDYKGDACDNCPKVSNRNQEDTFPPQGNGIGDACDCECDFTCDGDVDAEDVTAFITDFGREPSFKACTNVNPCKGDTNCDVDVDADDVNKFIEDFGREPSFKPCPPCVAGAWCVYPQ